MPLFYHKYVNYVLAHSVNYVITLYSDELPDVRKTDDGTNSDDKNSDERNTESK